MKEKISISEARSIWEKYLKTPYLKFHTLESMAIMQKLAENLDKDIEFWGITGLLHDLDMDIINGDYSQHGIKTVEILRREGYEIPVMFDAIIAHTEGVEGSQAKRKTDFEFILAGAENLTGIISAYVAIRPGKKIAGTKPKSIRKKLKTAAFAASVNRAFIYDAIEKSGLEETQFLQLAIEAFESISNELGM